MFELAPVSLWLEDVSDMRRLFEGWRARGVTDFEAFLREDPARVAACWASIKVVKVNRRTLALFEADSIGHLTDNLAGIFRAVVFDDRVAEMVKFWEGETQFSSAGANYTISGRRLDIQLSISILPGHEADWSRILVAVEDVTEREAARRARDRSEAYFRSLFDHSPSGLWVMDLSRIKRTIDHGRDAGILDFPAFLDAHPKLVRRCMGAIRVLDVNARTLSMFKAPDKPALIQRIDDVFRDETCQSFKAQLIGLWNGELVQQHEIVAYALDGSRLDVHLQFSVFPDHEGDWSLVLITVIDITARKTIEARLEFTSRYDAVTRLHNRAFYAEELSRIESQGQFPVTMVVADLNGLKTVNDVQGHAAGDALLKRWAAILADAVQPPHWAARIGGDEFVIVMPKAGGAAAEALIADILRRVGDDNLDHPTAPLSVALGAATGRRGEGLEGVFSRADLTMYRAKQDYYKTFEGAERRGERRRFKRRVVNAA